MNFESPAEKRRHTGRQVRYAANQTFGLVTSLGSSAYVVVSTSKAGYPALGAVAGLVAFVGLFLGLRALHREGTIEIPAKSADVRGGALALWLIGAVAVGAVSSLTNMMLIAAPMAHAEHLNSAIENIIEDSTIAVKGQRRAEGLVTTFEGTADVAETMLNAELVTGAICMLGGGRGGCTAALEAVIALSANSRSALIESKGTAAPIIRNIEDLQDDLRRTAGNESLSPSEKVAKVREATEEMRLLLEQLSAVIPLEAIEQGIQGYSQEWKSLGLSAGGVARFRSAFHPVASQLTDEYREIRATKNRDISSLKELNDFEVLFAEGQSVLPLIAVSAIFDILPILLVLLGMIGAGDEDRSTAPSGGGRRYRPRNPQPDFSKYRNGHVPFHAADENDDDDHLPF
ncbi:MAG: hypothetical protein AAGA22_06320 [Pseudomonadota bacterium]